MIAYFHDRRSCEYHNKPKQAYASISNRCIFHTKKIINYLKHKKLFKSLICIFFVLFLTVPYYSLYCIPVFSLVKSLQIIMRFSTLTK